MSVSQGLTAEPAPALLPSARSTKMLSVRPVPLHPGGCCCARTRGAIPITSRLTSKTPSRGPSALCFDPLRPQLNFIISPSRCVDWRPDERRIQQSECRSQGKFWGSEATLWHMRQPGMRSERFTARGAGWMTRFRGPRPLSGEGAVGRGRPASNDESGRGKLRHPRGARPAERCAEIRGQVREPREVTADFESVPLPEALARLLGGQDSALVYGEGGRLKAVRLVGGDQLGAPASPTITVPPAAPGAPFPGSLPELIDRHPPVPVTGQLAD